MQDMRWSLVVTIREEHWGQQQDPLLEDNEDDAC